MRYKKTWRQFNKIRKTVKKSRGGGGELDKEIEIIKINQKEIL